MNIVSEQTPHNSLSLKFTFGSEDYLALYKKEVNSYAQKAQIPGFRAGKVPTQLIQAKYGTSILFDILNKLVGTELDSYIKTNKLDIFGRPILKSHTLQGESLKPDKEYSFEFTLGLQPDFNLNLESLNNITKLVPEYTEKDINEQIDYFTKRLGKQDEVLILDADTESITHEILVNITQLDSTKQPLENGFVYKFFILTDGIKTKNVFPVNSKIGDKLEINLTQVFENPKDAASVLSISLEKATELMSVLFEFEIEKITQITKAEKNLDFFKQLTGKQDLTEEDDYMALYKEKFELEIQNLSNELLNKNIKKELLASNDVDFSLEIAESFVMNENKFETKEEMYAKYPQFLFDIKYSLIKSKIFRDNSELVITYNDIQESIKEEFKKYFNVPEKSKSTSTAETVEFEEVVNKEEHVHDENCNHDHDHEEENHSIEDEHPLMNYINNLTSQFMQDDSYVNKRYLELEEKRFFDFVTSKSTFIEKKVEFKDFLIEHNQI